MTEYTDTMTTATTAGDEPAVETYTLKRDGERNLVFDGQLLGASSSRRGTQDRWFEVEIYRTVAGAYVVAGSGRSALVGETDRCWAVICATGSDVIEALTRVDEDDIEYLTRTARDALNDAAAFDDVIRDAFFKRVA